MRVLEGGNSLVDLCDPLPFCDFQTYTNTLVTRYLPLEHVAMLRSH